MMPLDSRFVHVRKIPELSTHALTHSLTHSPSDVIGFVDVGNRLIINPDGSKSGDWRQALVEVRVCE